MTDYQKVRFAYDPRRKVLWRALYDGYFRRLIPEDGCLLELGAGYCDFINIARCKRRIAVDVWENVREYASPEVEVHVASATDLGGIADQTVDFVFASNLLEHLGRADVEKLLLELRRVLKPTGSLSLLQPNYKYAYREYFDDYTHVSVFSDTGLCDLLKANGYRILECHPRFMPLSMKSQLPVSYLLVRLYLLSPIKIVGKQMLVRAVRT
jgi:ubiquinone/menaquinone biosynthesis C-methylase UbiE